MQLFDGCAIAACRRAPGCLAACSGSGHRLLIAVKQGALAWTAALARALLGGTTTTCRRLAGSSVKTLALSRRIMMVERSRCCSSSRLLAPAQSARHVVARGLDQMTVAIAQAKLFEVAAQVVGVERGDRRPTA